MLTFLFNYMTKRTLNKTSSALFSTDRKHFSIISITSDPALTLHNLLL